MEKGAATITAVVCDPSGTARVLGADELDRIDQIRKGVPP